MFLYSLPLFFSQVGLASPFELLLICMALFVILLMTAPNLADFNKKQTDVSYLFGSWSGQFRLVWVFWPYFIILNASLYAADTLAKDRKSVV